MHKHICCGRLGSDAPGAEMSFDAEMEREAFGPVCEGKLFRVKIKQYSSRHVTELSHRMMGSNR